MHIQLFFLLPQKKKEPEINSEILGVKVHIYYLIALIKNWEKFKFIDFLILDENEFKYL